MAARDAGQADQFETAVRVFIFKIRPRIEAIITLKISDPTDCDQVIGDALTDAVRNASTITGRHYGEFFNWVKRIAQLRVADYYKRAKSKAQHVPIGPGEDEDGHPEIDPPDREREVEAVVIEVVIEEILRARTPAHAEVIQRRRRGEPSKQIAAEMDGGAEGEMTPANVDQIFSRFRKDLHHEMKASDG
ncbi:MAG: hypothetical protein M3Y45_02760 [Actinomycetota bacterium]|nr:hypothetical protein [Actinomycetota bacterium]